MAGSRPLPAGFSPSAASASTGPRLRLCTVTAAPARWRLSAIGLPMRPSPIRPILVPVTSVMASYRSKRPVANPGAAFDCGRAQPVEGQAIAQHLEQPALLLAGRAVGPVHLDGPRGGGPGPLFPQPLPVR